MCWWSYLSKSQLQELRPPYPFVRGTRYRTVRHHLSHMRNMHEEKEANGEQILISSKYMGWIKDSFITQDRNEHFEGG